MTHVHLYQKQDHAIPQRLCDVVDYVYGNDVSGNRVHMLREAGEWLAVLVQLTMKNGIYFALDRQAVAIILRHLFDDPAPTECAILQDIARVKPFLSVSDTALGLANIYHRPDNSSPDLSVETVDSNGSEEQNDE
jgi:hypothetical protein